MLIAIVVDTYDTIRDDKTEEVFWSSRLDFVAEVEVIKALMKNLLKNLCGICNCKPFKGICGCQWFTQDRWFMLFIRFILGAVTCGLLWPDTVRTFLWGDHSPKDDESMKNCIQHMKKILTFEEKKTALEVQLNAMVSEIKNDAKSKNDQMMKEMNDNKSKNEQMIREMNDKVDAILGFIQHLSKEKQTEGSISGDNNTRSLDVPQTAFILTNPAENINQLDVTSNVQG
jgi:hypothetical protein